MSNNGIPSQPSNSSDKSPNPQSRTTSSSASDSKPSTSTSTTAKPAKRPPHPNPALRLLGIPHIKPRLPSRNWLIFLTLSTSIAATIYHDRRERRLATQKWCTLVSHRSQEPLSPHQMPRRVTVYLAAPPGDSVRTVRQHFHEYVKPVLVSGGVEWDVVEGRGQGGLRWGEAERVRRKRRAGGEMEDAAIGRDVGGGNSGTSGGAGEGGAEKPSKEEAERVKADAIDALRKRSGIQESDEIAGDIVIGRHTWKEYIRGLHEGWLGPLKAPTAASVQSASAGNEGNTAATYTEQSGRLSDIAEKRKEDDDPPATPDPEIPISPKSDPLTNKQPEAESRTSETQISTGDPTAGQATSSSETPSQETETPPPPPAQKPPFPPSYNTPSTYSSSPSPPSFPKDPDHLPPTTPIPFPHTLGFLNTPIRIYRFLTRRYLADDVGRATAAAVLASYRPFEHDAESTGAGEDGVWVGDGGLSEGKAAPWEQNQTLKQEEIDWPKYLRKELEERQDHPVVDDDGRTGARKEDKEETKEKPWVDEMVLDDRIARGMRAFTLEKAEEERAGRIDVALRKGAAGVPGLGRAVDGTADGEAMES
ncbi:MAG: mitochondrial import inner membrane translocase subunit tim54 [Alyxoria varia]|nr:MAG: mitochondrial import inner membrane translocase subunit tim54 [Alyxoria varia]